MIYFLLSKKPFPISIPVEIPTKNSINGPISPFEIKIPVIANAGAIPIIAFLGMDMCSFFDLLSFINQLYHINIRGVLNNSIR